MTQSDSADAIRGALLGLAVADALGAPFEFGSAAECSRRIADGLEMTGGRGWLLGEFTDDTDMALCLAESIAEHGLLNLDDLAARYIPWADSGPKDIGMITSSALRGAKGAADATERARLLRERTGLTAGNGTVMRAAPIGLATIDRAEASTAARADALLTHHDPAAGAASAALCAGLIAIRRHEGPLAAAAAEIGDHDKLYAALALVRGGDEAGLAALAGGRELGVCWTALGVGLYALTVIDDYEEGVAWAISLGGDTDTNAAVAGALLGCRHGVDAIPARWLNVVRERERIEKVAAVLALLHRSTRRSLRTLPAAARLRAGKPA